MDDLIAGYLESAGEMSELFLNIATDIADGGDPMEFMDEVFRCVHSLKGTAGFLKEDDDRLGPFETYCHRFETFLDVLRKRQAGINKERREVFENGLRMLADNIDRLSAGDAMGDCTAFLEKCAASVAIDPPHRKPVVKAPEFMDITVGPKVVRIALKQSVKTTGDSLDFTRALHAACEEGGSGSSLELNLNGYRLSSIGVGAVLSAKVKVADISLMNTPRIMEVYCKHFGFLQFGISVSGMAGHEEQVHA